MAQYLPTALTGLLTMIPFLTILAPLAYSSAVQPGANPSNFHGLMFLATFVGFSVAVFCLYHSRKMLRRPRFDEDVALGQDEDYCRR